MAITVTEAKAKLSELVNRAAYGHERILVGARGRPKAALISLADLERLEDLEDAQDIREAIAAEARGETISLEELEANLLGGSSAVQR